MASQFSGATMQTSWILVYICLLYLTQTATASIFLPQGISSTTNQNEFENPHTFLAIIYQEGSEELVDALTKHLISMHTEGNFRSSITIHTIFSSGDNILFVDELKRKGVRHHLTKCHLALVFHMHNASKANSKKLLPQPASPFTTGCHQVETVSPNQWKTFEILSTFHNVIFSVLQTKPASVRDRRIRISMFDIQQQYFEVNGRKTGVSHEIAEAASRFFNCSYELYLHLPQIRVDKNGIQRGMEYEVSNGFADMLLIYTPSCVNPDINIECTTTFFPAWLQFITKHPVKRGIQWSAFLHIFDVYTWLMFISFWVISTLLMYLVLRWTKWTGPATTSVSIAYRAAVGQDYGKAIPKPIRELSIVFVFGCMLITNYYTMDLLATLTCPYIESVPKSFTELALRQDFDIYSLRQDGGAVEQLFNNTHNLDLKSIWTRTTLSSYELCVIRAVTQPNTVCMGMNFDLDGVILANVTVNSEFSPALRSEGQSPINVLAAAILPRSSPYMNGMNFVIGWSRDCGLYDKWEYEFKTLSSSVGRSWHLSKERINSSLTKELRGLSLGVAGGPDTAEQLKLENLTMPFALVSFGCILGLVGFALEFGNGMKAIDVQKMALSVRKLLVQ